jgi:hypothetical protein
MARDNPLMTGNRPVPHSRSVDDHCEFLNSFHWVRSSGKPYFVSMLEDGTRYVNRAA